MRQALAVWYVGDGSPVPKRSGKDRPRSNAVSLRAGKLGPYSVKRYFATDPFLYYSAAKKATATAPGPTWVPTTLPTMDTGRLSTRPSQRAALSWMYFCSRASLRPV